MISLKTFIGLFKKRTNIYLIGDSTMCIYDASLAPRTGWGVPFANYFNDTAIIKNRARSGYSTITFINQHFWRPIANRLQKGDYVLIQFGHNDENIQEPNIYTSPKDYGINLLKFITETKEKNAHPILITPVARRQFDEDGQVRDTHHQYSEMARYLAKQQNIPLIDLDKLSRDLLQQWGDEKSKMLFNYLSPNENPNYPAGMEDDTHFNELGARKIAQLVLLDIQLLQITLADKIRGFGSVS